MLSNTGYSFLFLGGLYQDVVDTTHSAFHVSPISSVKQIAIFAMLLFAFNSFNTDTHLYKCSALRHPRRVTIKDDASTMS